MDRLTPPADPVDQTMKGIGLASLGYGLFSIQDATVKWLVAEYAVPQILFTRSIVILAIACAIGGRGSLVTLAQSRRKLALAVRALLMLAAWMLFYTAARVLGLAQLTTIYFVAPIIVVVLAALVLREQVSATRWVAVSIGFVGAVLASDPGGAFSLQPTIQAFLAALCWALSIVMARSISRTETTTSIILVSNGLFAVTCAVSLFWFWKTPDLFSLGLMVGLGVASAIGQFCLYDAFRYAPASAIAPTEYGGLIWAFLFGYWIWGDVPRANVFAGALLIVAGSLVLVLSERRRARLA